jgi:hypothetical protein
VTSRLIAGAVLLAGGLALHLIEPVSVLECTRDVPGTARCTIRRSFFGVLPYRTTDLPAIAALVAEPERLSRTDPLAVTCTSLSVMDGDGDATRFACVKDGEAVARARSFFADASAERALRVSYSETIVLAASGIFILAGVLALLAAAARRRRPPSPPRRGPSDRARS